VSDEPASSRKIDQLLCAASRICDGDALQIYNVLVQSVARFCYLCGKGRAELMASAINALNDGRDIMQADAGKVPS
jgi:hypothetical protein